MKLAILIAFISSMSLCYGQWHTTSIGNFGTISDAPANQLIVDPYRNTIWLANDLGATAIENDGTLKTFGTNELGSLWSSCELQFAFTEDHIYYIRELIGLYSFDNYTPQNIFSSQVIEKVFTDLDTVFFYDGGGDAFSHVSGVGTSPVWLPMGEYFISKNGRKYKHSGSSVSYIRSAFDIVSFSQVPGYLISPANTFSFHNYTDTLFVGQVAGISVLHADSVLRTITPSNSVDMPSPNVLDIAFDKNDSLWAVFGDSNDIPISLAKLEGSNWTNIYDENNSPIDFPNFLGIEFDTLNNIWVADYDGLHTLVNGNSPGWLGNIELSNKSSLSVFPNPSNGDMEIAYKGSVNPSFIAICDLSGREVWKGNYSPFIKTNLQSGNYVLSLFLDDLVINRTSIRVE